MEEGSHSKEEYVSYCHRSLDTNCGIVTILDLGFRLNYGKNKKFLFKQSFINSLEKIISQISRLISKFVNMFSRMAYCF